MHTEVRNGHDTDDSNGLVAELVRFDEFGSPTYVGTRNGVGYYFNEFWTSRQRQAHRIHEISYRACFKPQLPAFFIERLTRPGDVVYDPFMGRGTTPIEAAIRHRVPYGNDASPLSRALTEPRVQSPAIEDIHQRLDEIPWQDFKTYQDCELLAFYHPATLAQIEGLRNYFLDRASAGTLDQVDAWIRMVAINRLTGHSPGFMSVYTMPPNQAVSVAGQLRINARRGQTPPIRCVPSIIRKKSASLLSHGPVATDRFLFLTGRSNSTPEIADQTVALTVTSPPFLDIVNYEHDNWLRCWFIGINSRSVDITSHGTVAGWREFIRSSLCELARITRPGGHVAFEVGEVRNQTILLEDHVIRAAAGLPFATLGVMVNQQNFTKTSNCWGVDNNSGGTNSNRIVLLQRLRPA